MNLQFLFTAGWFSSLLLSGCNSSDPTTGTTIVSGQVIAYKTGAPVPSAWVQIWHSSRIGGYHAIGTDYPTDNHGCFSFSFEATDDADYILLATAPPGYFTDWALGPHPVAGRATSNLTIPTYAPAWFKIHLINSSHRKQRSLTIGGYYGGSSPGGTEDRFYDPKDTVFIRRTLAIYQPSSVSWFITHSDGSSSQDYKQVNPTPLDTVVVDVPF